MEQLLTTIPAHFDGKEIILDAPVKLEPNVRLLVTILDPSETQQGWIETAMQAAVPAFARVWDNDEDAIYDNL